MQRKIDQHPDGVRNCCWLLFRLRVYTAAETRQSGDSACLNDEALGLIDEEYQIDEVPGLIDEASLID